MSERPADLATLLEALIQQQTALVQVHGENLRLQRLLIEHLVGGGSVARWVGEHTRAEPATSVAGPPVTAAPVGAVGTKPPAESTPAATGTLEQAPIAPAAGAETPPPSPDGEQVGARRIGRTVAARYYQAPPSRPARPISREELELLHELHDLGDVGKLVLQFGPHKGSTLAQVARTDPEYLRQLVRGAQRPEVRAAAQRLVAALDAVEHQPRGLRARGRRNGR
jgi:hypothetical protein